MRVMPRGVSSGDSENMAPVGQTLGGVRTAALGRAELLADLNSAVRASSPPQTFAILVLGGLEHFRDLYGRIEAEALVVLSGALLRDLLDRQCRIYQPRAGEFAVVAPGQTIEVRESLMVAAETLSERFDQSGVNAAVGAVLLPNEASRAHEALILADERLLSHAVGRLNRDRRQTPRS